MRDDAEVLGMSDKSDLSKGSKEASEGHRRGQDRWGITWTERAKTKGIMDGIKEPGFRSQSMMWMIQYTATGVDGRCWAMMCSTAPH